MDAKYVHQPMVTGESDELKSTNNPTLSDPMNLSVAFNEIVIQEPPMYTELCETVNKIFEEICESIR